MIIICIMISQKIIKRINLEINQIKEENIEGIEIIPSDNIQVFFAKIDGPKDSPYENGVYELKVTIPNNYPLAPPKIIFTNDMYHPNVYANGSICVDILRNDQWTPSLRISTALLSIRSLFTDPDPTSAANPEAGKLYVSNREEFYNRVKKLINRKS